MKILLPLAALASAFAGGSALAQAPAAPASVTIRYADLDLGSAAGRRVLDRRIGLAVREACGTASDVDLHGRNAVVACRAETRAAAEAQRSATVARRPAADRFAAGR